MQIADDSVVGLGHHGGFGIGVDNDDRFGPLAADVMLNRTADAASDIHIGGDSGSGLTDLIGMGAPALIGHCPRAANSASDKALN